ncbi:MAG: hypothetical protein MJZ31_05935 [Bacteroidales bacterium]|nr:hypothetical protein [Bacteroidales bacterium]
MDIKYALADIKETKFAFNYDFDYNSFNIGDLGFGFSYNFKADLGKNTLVIELTVLVVYGTTRMELSSTSTANTFIIDPIEEVVKFDEDKQVKAHPLLDTFLNVCIGTIRGIMLKNFKNTPLDGVVLPLIPMPLHKK